VSGEVTLAVGPLSLPDPGGANRPSEALGSDAVRLFVERAREQVPEFELTAANAAAGERVGPAGRGPAHRGRAGAGRRDTRNAETWFRESLGTDCPNGYETPRALEGLAVTAVRQWHPAITRWWMRRGASSSTGVTGRAIC
jgi:hypothetical protein